MESTFDILNKILESPFFKCEKSGHLSSRLGSLFIDDTYQNEKNFSIACNLCISENSEQQSKYFDYPEYFISTLKSIIQNTPQETSKENLEELQVLIGKKYAAAIEIINQIINQLIGMKEKILQQQDEILDELSLKNLNTLLFQYIEKLQASKTAQELQGHLNEIQSICILENQKFRLKTIKEFHQNTMQKFYDPELDNMIESLNSQISALDQSNYSHLLIPEILTDITPQVDDIMKLQVKMKQSFQMYTDFYNTLICTKEQKLILIDWLPQELQQLTPQLIFKASRDGYDQVLKHIQGQSPTIIICRSTLQRIFGFFTVIPWRSEGGFKEDRNSFLFSLTHQTQHEIKNPKYAVNHRSISGLSIGGSGDLGIAFINEENSHWSEFPDQFHGLPQQTRQTQATKAYLAGSKQFQLEDYEIYQLC